MSNKIKFGESYQSIAENIKPYLESSINKSVYSIEIYPPWWETTITIYNKYEDTTTQLVTWYKTFLNNCYFKNIYELLELGNITANNNSTLVRIPQNSVFKSYEEWIKIPTIDMNKYFTLHQGDIVIRGEISDNIDETKRGMYSTDIIEKYNELGVCTVIQGVQINTGTGLGTPHYRIVGD